jgi:dipeptidase
MRKIINILLLVAGVQSIGFNGDSTACTNLLVTKGASEDGSVMITYTCDGEFHPHLEYTPAADYEPGDSMAIEDWHGNVRGYITQVEHTYAVVDMINEHQLAISETTFDGRLDLKNPDGLLHYWDLMYLALQRARTAREAITVITDLAEEYGYRSTGESISIADPKECWLLEIIGPGPGGKGAHWVALRIPDGYISAHANKARIGIFPLDDPENCRYSENVIDFAIEQGFYDPDSGEPFRFNEAYCPSNAKNRRYASTRVWSIFRRAAPSMNLSDDYHRSIEGSEPYPLWIKPDKKLSLADVFALMRDHYEGTPYDMTKGVDAGEYGSPYRWRPMYFRVDSVNNPDVEYMWERPISTQQTGFSFVSQSRSRLPDPIGGVLWYGVDDTYFTCYFPLYCGINNIPPSYTIGSLQEFSWESAWWIFNLVSNYANLKYAHMIKDIQKVQSEIESNFIALQPTVEANALALYDQDRDLLISYLTDYSVGGGESVMRKWQELAKYLICKYNDGYVKDEDGRPQDAGYPEEWLETVVDSRPDQFKLPPPEDSTVETRLID